MYTLSHPQAMWEPVDRSVRVAVHPLGQPRIGGACGFLTDYKELSDAFEPADAFRLFSESTHGKCIIPATERGGASHAIGGRGVASI